MKSLIKLGKILYYLPIIIWKDLNSPMDDDCVEWFLNNNTIYNDSEWLKRRKNEIKTLSKNSNK